MIEPFVVLSLAMLPFLLAMGVLALSFVVMIVSIAGEPQRAWAWMAAGVILGCGPILYGQLILDELAVVLALVALVLHRLGHHRQLQSGHSRSRLERWHVQIFATFIVYMLAQAVRGAVLGDVLDGSVDLPKLRWVVFFPLIWLAGTLRVDGRRNAAEHGRMVARGLTVAWAVYLLIYLVWGMADEVFSGDRFASQLNHWGTPAYTLSPLVVAFPATMLTLRDPRAGYRRLAFISLLLSTLAVLFYDARVGVLAMVSFAAVALLFVNWRAVLPLVGVSLLSLWVVSTLLWSDSRDFDFFLSDVFESGSSLFVPAEERATARDWDRAAHLEIGLTTYRDGPVMFLVGTGYRHSGPYVSSRLGGIFRGYGVTRTVAISDDEATEAFTALIVETGAIGFALFLANVGLTMVRIWRMHQGPMRTVLLWAGALIVLWMPVINYLTAIWLFLAIAPSGLLVQLGAVPLNARRSHRRVAVGARGPRRRVTLAARPMLTPQGQRAQPTVVDLQ